MKYCTHGLHTPFDYSLEVVTAGSLVDGVYATRVLDELDEVVEFWRRIAREPGEGGLFPEKGDQIRLDI